MKKIFLLFLLFAGSAAAQKVNVNWGQPIQSETTIYQFLAEKGGSFYVLSGKGNDLYLESYSSSTFAQRFSKKLDVPQLNDKDQDIESVFFLGNQFVLFTSQYNGKADVFSVHAYTIDQKGIMGKDSPEILNVSATSRKEAGDISFYMSGDSTHIMAVHNAIFRKENVQRITIKVLDVSLATTTTATEDFPMKEDGAYCQLSNYCINNTGDLYFLQTKITPASRKTPQTVENTIISFGKDGQRKKDFPIDLEGKRIDQLLFSFDMNQNLIISGFYESESGKGIFNYLGISGTFFMSVDKASGEVKSKSFQDFDNDLLSTYYTQKQMTKSPLLPNNFVPRKIIPKDDGGVVSIYEQYSYSYAAGNGQSVESTVYGNLLVTNINPDGTIKWVKLIPKNQVFIQRQALIGFGGTVSVGYMFDLKKDQTIYYSFLVAIKDDKIIFVFNDEPENQKVQAVYDTKMMTKIKGTVPMMVTLSENGDITKKTLFDATDFDIIIRPRIALQTSETRILIYGSKGDTDKFGVMTIDSD